MRKNRSVPKRVDCSGTENDSTLQVEGEDMHGEHAEVEKPSDSPDAIRFAFRMASVWLLAMMVIPRGGLLWQWGLVQKIGGWLMGNVLAHLDLIGLFA